MRKSTEHSNMWHSLSLHFVRCTILPIEKFAASVAAAVLPPPPPTSHALRFGTGSFCRCLNECYGQIIDSWHFTNTIKAMSDRLLQTSIRHQQTVVTKKSSLRIFFLFFLHLRHFVWMWMCIGSDGSVEEVEESRRNGKAHTDEMTFFCCVFKIINTKRLLSK